MIFKIISKNKKIFQNIVESVNECSEQDAGCMK